jgi:hypothetical protein
MLKIHAEYERDTSSAKFKEISHKLSTSLLVDCCNQRDMMDDTGMIITQMRKYNTSENGRIA